MNTLLPTGNQIIQPTAFRDPPPSRPVAPRGSVKAAKREQLAFVLRVLGKKQLDDGVAVKPTPGIAKNDWESRYGSQLHLRMMASDIAMYAYQPIRLRLATAVWYTPDYIVRHIDNTIECVEVKGFMREAANLRLKIAVDRFPQFRFTIAKLDKGNWTHRKLLRPLAAAGDAGERQPKTEST